MSLNKKNYIKNDTKQDKTIRSDMNFEKIQCQVVEQLRSSKRNVTQNIKKVKTRNKYFAKNFSLNYKDDKSLYNQILNLTENIEKQVALQTIHNFKKDDEKTTVDDQFLEQIKKKTKSQQIKNEQLLIKIQQVKNSVFVDRLFHHDTKKEQDIQKLQDDIEEALQKQKHDTYIQKLEHQQSERKKRKIEQKKLMKQSKKDFFKIQQQERLYQKFENSEDKTDRRNKTFDITKYKKKPKFKKNENLKSTQLQNDIQEHKNFAKSNVQKKVQYSRKIRQDFQPALDTRQHRYVSRLKQKQLKIQSLKQQRAQKIEDNKEKERQYLHQGYEFYQQNKQKLIEKAKQIKPHQNQRQFQKINYLRNSQYKIPIKQKKLQQIQKTDSNIENMIDSINYSDKKSKNILYNIQSNNRKPNESEQEMLKELYKENIERKIKFIKKAFNNQFHNMNAPKKKFFQLKQLQFYKREKNIVISSVLITKITLFCLYIVNTFKLWKNTNQNFYYQNLILFIVIFSFQFNLIYYIYLAFVNPGYYQDQTYSTFINKFKNYAKNHSQIENSNIEENFCAECSITQHFRTKHCRSCNLCVLTYDHHCFWLDNCIGEKNRVFYVLYLFSIIIQIKYYIFLIFIQHNHKNFLDYFFIIFMILLCSNIFYLFCLHIYLLANNLTTWEYFSWQKITYLQNFNKKEGSPFSIGPMKNIQLFLDNSPQSRIDWSFSTDIENANT